MASNLFATKELKKSRIKLGWSQMELSQILTLQCGIKASQSSIQKWENGRMAITPANALEFARLLKTPVDKLVERVVIS